MPLIESRYGLVLGIKVAVFVVMLALGDQGRTYADTVAARAKTAGPEQIEPLRERAFAGRGDGEG